MGRNLNPSPMSGLGLLLAVALGVAPVASALALTLEQTYYVPMGEGELFTLFNDVGTTGAPGWPPTSPIENRIAITIAVSGTQIVWDHWEGGYEADLANPQSVCNLTSPFIPAPGNNCTQIWGDNNPSNGCAANVLGRACSGPNADVLSAGDVIRLEDAVALDVSNQRNPAQVFFDGRDRFGTTRPVVMTRAAIPTGPGSLLAGGTEVAAETSPAWSTSFRVPIGENLEPTNTGAFEKVYLFIMAGSGGTVTVGATNYTVTQGQSLVVPGGVDVGTQVTSTVPIQVHVAAFEDESQYQLRWFQLVPVAAFSSEYLSPIGTNRKSSGSTGCTEVWAYNPNASQITINVDLPGGPVPDHTFNVPAGQTTRWPDSLGLIQDLLGDGIRLYTTGSPAPTFLPLQIVDCTNMASTIGFAGQIYDWGVPLIPIELLTTSVIVGGAPGCTNAATAPAICSAPNLTSTAVPELIRNGAQASRSVVWVTPLANTTLYVDKDGSGISCPSGAGAEETVTATALASYRFVDDPVRGSTWFLDTFSSVSYSNQNGNNAPSTNWATNWVEEGPGTDTSASGGRIRITGNQLRFGTTGGTFQPSAPVQVDAGICRRANLTAAGFSTALLEFDFQESAGDANDEITYYVRNGTTGPRTALGRVDGTHPNNSRKHDISAFIGTSTEICFIVTRPLEGSDFFFFDNVRISNGRGDYDMTGARIATCNGVAIAAAYGQDPARSASVDGEGLDYGTIILPFGSAIRVEKSVDVTAPVTPGTIVTYTYLVYNDGQVPLDIVPGDPGGGGPGVGLTDDKCSPVSAVLSGVNNVGDTNANGLLDTEEVWQYTCSAAINVVTTNVVTACGLPQSPGATNICDNDEQTVYVFPTAVTLGEFKLDPMAVEDYLKGLGVAELDAAALLELLRAWDPTAAAALAGANRAALMAALRAYLDPDGDGRVAVLRWETLEERGTIGFFVERSADGGPWHRIGNAMLPGLIASPMGAEYRLADPGARPGHRYEYWLVEQEAVGTTRSYGPFSLEMP